MRRVRNILTRSGMTGLLAGAMLMLGGGVGVAMALSTSSAGASTAHSSLPPVNVSVSNQPTVNVGNLPTNGAGRLKVASGGTTYDFGFGPWGTVQNSQQPFTLVNVNGSGRFIGMNWGGGRIQGQCNPFDGTTTVYIDGHQVYFVVWSWVGWPGQQFFGGAGASGGQTGPCNVPVGHFFPPGGMPFKSSLVVQMQPAPWWNQPNQGVHFWGEGSYTLNS